MNPATIDVGAPLTPHDIIAVARSGAQVTVGDDAMERVKRASDLVESLADDPQPPLRHLHRLRRLGLHPSAP